MKPLWNSFILGTLFIALFLPLTTTAALPTPDSIEADVRKNGGTAVIQNFANHWDQWTVVTTGISSGSERWLKIYRLLKPHSDASISETLDIALSKALTARPQEVLTFIEREHATDTGTICGRLDDDADESTFIPFLKKQKAAIEKVTSRSLQTIKSRCLAAITQAIKYQQDQGRK